MIIIDDKQHIVGILSMSDLMRFLVSTFESNLINLKLKKTKKLIFYFYIDFSRTSSNTSNGHTNGTVFESEPMDT